MIRTAEIKYHTKSIGGGEYVLLEFDQDEIFINGPYGPATSSYYSHKWGTYMKYTDKINESKSEEERIYNINLRDSDI